MKIGFIGLGRMGAPMARNIARSGAELVVWDLSPDAVQALVADGARAGESAAHVTSQVDVLFTSLPGPVESEAVVFGPAGILEAVRAGLVYFDLSTNSLALIRRIHQAFAERGATMLDAPVSGGPAGADSGKLAIWAGGDQAVFERHLPTLRTFSDSPRRIGEIGAGTVAKLVHNLSCYAMRSVLAETFSLGVKAGVDPMDLYEALYAGVMGRGSILELLHPKFLSGQWNSASFALKLGRKDVALALDLGKQVGVPMRVCAQTLEDFTEALAKDMGDLDSGAFMDLQLKRAGVRIAVDPERIALGRERIAASRAAPSTAPSHQPTGGVA
jgi:3-hydroxyisobutyrate dehydrogenase